MKRLVFILTIYAFTVGAMAQIPNLTSMEYFIDVDPGHGKGVDIPITPGATQDLNFSISTGSLPLGFHTLSIRTRDANSIWSHFETRPFYVAPSTTESRENITAMEYYLDLDPGQGNGTAVAVTPNADLDLVEMVPTSSLTAGFHTIAFRVQSESGVWSMAESQAFFIAKSTTQSRENITAMEYFFDRDPGQGNGTAVTVTTNTDLDLVEMVPTSSLTTGFHTIAFRVQSESGVWSMAESQAFFIAKSTTQSRENITAMEYFFDRDPGQGNGTAVTVTTNTDLDLVEMVPTSSLTAGFHTIAFRVQSESGVWSMAESQAFFIAKSTTQSRENITAMEYFFDRDPGQGNGTAVTATTNTDLDLIEMVPTSSLTAGFHTIAFRVQSESGAWSMAEQQPFYVAPATSAQLGKLHQLEYFIDIDPGYGQATSITFSGSQQIDIVQSISLQGLEDGFHTIIVRGQNENGIWGHIESQPFYIDASRTIDLLDYAFDNDPGIGLGTHAILNPQSAQVDTALVLPNPGLSLGNHDLIARVEDGLGSWSEPVTAQFTICEGALADFTIDNITCENSPVSFTDQSINTINDDVYSWDFDGNGVIDSNKSEDINFTYSTPGTYSITLTVDRSGCASSKTKEVTINETPVVIANASESTICLGETVTVSGDGAVTYLWDHGIEDQVAFSPVETTTYAIVGTDENGCTATDQIEIAVSATETPTISLVSSEKYQGVTLASSSETGNQWFENGMLIEGATAQVLEVHQSTIVTLQVTSNECPSNISTEFEVFVLSIKEESALAGLSLWPNPVRGKIHLQLEPFDDHQTRYQISSLKGQTIKQGLIKNLNRKSIHSIRVNDLKPGIYLILIEQAGIMLTSKFVKQ